MCGIWIFALTTIYSCVLLPLYVFAETDVLLVESVLPIILEWVYPLVDTVSLTLGFGFVIYAIYEFDLRGAWSVIGVPAVAIAYKYIADLVISFVMSGESMGIDYAYTLVYIILELALLIAIIIIANRFISAYKEQECIRIKGLKFLGKENTERPLLPFTSVMDLKNPIQKAIFVTSVIMSAIKIVLRIRLDIFIGAPSGLREVLTMVIYYISDVLVMPISYIVMSLGIMGAYAIRCRLYAKHGTNDESL